MSEEVLLCCTRVAEGKNPVTGSTRASCSDCGAGVWHSAASIRYAMEKAVSEAVELKIICMDCFIKRNNGEKATSSNEKWRHYLRENARWN